MSTSSAAVRDTTFCDWKGHKVFDVVLGRSEAALEAYLDEAQRLGLRALRIIHGEGIGVQREMVRSVLGRTPFVAEFWDAPLEAGAWGATLVTLSGPSE